MKRRDGERGVALIIVIFASTLILLLLMTTLTVTQTSNRVIARQLQSQGQALSTANAGLTESLSWFVRQRVQPVTSFNPVVDANGVCTHTPPHDPLALDSEDPAVGIVRSYEITALGKVWGRYEVRRADVRDVSIRRGKPQVGTIWQVESEGIVYVNNDTTKLPDVAPNRVLARKTVYADIQRLGLQLPNQLAAMSSVRRSNVTITRPSRIAGGTSGTGLASPASTGNVAGNGTISGNPALGNTATPFSINSIFGVTTNELIAMADLVVDDQSQLPDDLPGMSLIVIRNSATFTSSRPLKGSGILVVLGNLTLDAGSNTYYSGVIWVGGTFTMSPPGLISGSVVANSTVTINGGSDVAEINFDSAMIDQIRQQMGNYLFSRSRWLEMPVWDVRPYQ